MKITKIAAALMLSGAISLLSVANATGDYVFRTENSYNTDSINVQQYDGYNHVFIF